MTIHWLSREEIGNLSRLDHEAQQRQAALCHCVALAEMDVPTFFGKMTLCASAFGVSMLFFPETQDYDVMAKISYYGAGVGSYGRKMAFEAGLELMGYTIGEVKQFETPVDLSFLTPFQQDVLLATRQIPFGRTATPGEIARAAGYPGKGGAAAMVLRHNPLPIIVPCHRIIAQDGRLGSYCDHPETKRFLLSHEGVDIPLPMA